MPISSLFLLPKLVKIFMASFKRREATKIFPFLSQICAEKAPNGAKRRKFFTILNEIVQKKLKLTIERENSEEIHQKQGKCP